MSNVEKKHRKINFALLMVCILTAIILFQVISIKTNFTTNQMSKGAKTTKIDTNPTLEIPRNLNLNNKRLSQNLNKNAPFTGFVENQGQLSSKSILIYFKGSTSFIGFAQSKIYFIQKNNNKSTAFFIDFVNSNHVLPTGINKLGFSSNFFIGNTQKTGVKSYQEVWYFNIYPNIDLRYYISETGLNYEFIVHPAGNPNTIQMKISNSVNLKVSSDSIYLQSLDKSSVVMSESNLHVYQGTNVIVNSKFIQLGTNEYSFSVTNYNKTIPLVIDPFWVQFSTYLGGSGADFSNSVKIDSSGNIYLVGFTNSVNLNITSNLSLDNLAGQDDVFVMKLNPTGTKILYNTIIGGNYTDEAWDFSLDKSNDVIIGGATNSTDFPIIKGFQKYAGGFDGFITGLNSTGNGLLFSSYLGGAGNDYIYRIVLDTNSNIYVTGKTNSNPFPPNVNGTGTYDVFVTKLNFNLNLLFTNLIQANGADVGNGLAIDSSDNIYVSGSTTSTNFPPIHAYHNSLLGSKDAFVTEFASDGSGPIFSSYLGGNSSDASFSVAVNSQNDIIVTGNTNSNNFPTINPIISSNPKSNDIFVSIFNSSYNLIDSTYLGGNSSDFVADLELDSSNNLYLTGTTISPNFPIVNGPYSNLNTNGDAYVIKLNPNATSILFSSFLGGSQYDVGLSTATFNSSIYVTGYTLSTDFPQVNSLQPYSSSSDGFLTIFGFDNDTPIIINKPGSLNINFGSVGNILSWTATDTNPNMYNIYRDGALLINNTWTSGIPVSINIDNLNIGSYYYTIIFSDKVGLIATDTVYVTVVNSAANSIPTVDSPANEQSKEFLGTLNILWIGTGNNPTTYTIYENGKAVQTGSWSSNVVIDFKQNWYFKASGYYNYTIQLYNSYGNSVSNSVFLTVLASTAVKQSLQIVEPIVAAIIIINAAAIVYQVAKNNNNNDPDDPPNVPAGITIASNNEYIFVGWIGSDTHPIIQWLLNKKIAVILIFLMRLFRVDSKHHLFIAIASNDKKDFPNSDSWIYQTKIKHDKSKFRPSMIAFENKLYIAVTSMKNEIQLKSISLENKDWNLEDESLPITNPAYLKSITEPTLTKDFDLSKSKYVRIILSFYSMTTGSIVIYYLENGVWNLSIKNVHPEKFKKSLSSTVYLSEQNNNLAYTWVANKKIYTKFVDDKVPLPNPLKSSTGGTQLNYVSVQSNVIKHGMFMVYKNKSIRLAKYDFNQNKWIEIKKFKKKTKFPPAIAQFNNDIYVVWINKPSPFYIKEFFLATIVNNLTQHDIIEYEPLEFEKVTPNELDSTFINQNETRPITEDHSINDDDSNSGDFSDHNSF